MPNPTRILAEHPAANCPDYVLALSSAVQTFTPPDEDTTDG